jgi:FKBP-type peptidyl-prolyl cis-trans isomerase
MMKKFAIAAIAAAVVLTVGCNEKANDAVSDEIALETLDQKVSYIFGYNLGKNAKAGQFMIDSKVLAEALDEAMEDKESRLSQDDIKQVMEQFQQKQEAMQAVAVEEARKEMAEAAEKNKVEGEAFLVENGKKDGVVTTDSGLQYKVITAGDGVKPGAEDKVEVHYTGRLLDGKVFDSSVTRGKTITFGVNGVIPGWTEVLQLMPEGSKWEVYIPSDLAYGPGGTGGDIGPNAALVFEVELIKVNPSEEVVPAEPAAE